MACPRDEDTEYFFTWTLVGLNDIIIYSIKADKPRMSIEKIVIFKDKFKI